jgi:anti-sigma B factor antagonist
MQDTSPPLALEGAVTIYVVHELKAQLLAGVRDNAELRLDLSQVTELDSAGLQLLYLAKREAINNGHALRIVAHSDAVREVIDLSNLNAYFGDPTLIPAHKPTRQDQ